MIGVTPLVAATGVQSMNCLASLIRLNSFSEARSLRGGGLGVWVDRETSGDLVEELEVSVVGNFDPQSLCNR